MRVSAFAGLGSFFSVLDLFHLCQAVRVSAFAGLGSLSFSAYRGSEQLATNTTPLMVGDTFQVVVTGAPANGQVTVTRSDGASATLGTTDADGNYTYSGAINSSYPLGSFLETWDVNGQVVGQYTFFIVAVAAAPAASPTAPAAPPAVQTPAIQTATCQGISLGSTCIPTTYAVAAAIGLGVLLLHGVVIPLPNVQLVAAAIGLGVLLLLMGGKR